MGGPQIWQHLRREYSTVKVGKQGRLGEHDLQRRIVDRRIVRPRPPEGALGSVRAGHPQHELAGDAAGQQRL